MPTSSQLHSTVSSTFLIARSQTLRQLASRKGKDIHLSHVTSALIVSPTFPPELRYVTERSVETPVAKSPREATAREPPRSVMQAIVPPWRMLRRFLFES